mgnify:CR=1 FL=1
MLYISMSLFLHSLLLWLQAAGVVSACATPVLKQVKAYQVWTKASVTPASDTGRTLTLAAR